MSELESLYERWCKAGRASSAHLPTLRRLATGLDLAVEFGCKQGASATALLLGAKRVISVDILETREARRLEALVGDRWEYRIANTLLTKIPPCDLLFVDSLHTYEQCKGELLRHGGLVRKYIAFHDTITFGSVGADGETGRQSWTYEPGKSVPKIHLGIRQAIDEFMMNTRDWDVKEAHWQSHGLLVLERRA